MKENKPRSLAPAAVNAGPGPPRSPADFKGASVSRGPRRGSNICGRPVAEQREDGTAALGGPRVSV